MPGRSGVLPVSVALSSEGKNKPNPLKILFKMILCESSKIQEFHGIYFLYFSPHNFLLFINGVIGIVYKIATIFFLHDCKYFLVFLLSVLSP